jgi:hypothetical protein
MRQLLAYRFDAEARFQGQLVGALERMESGGTLRIIEVLFIVHHAETGELSALDLRSRGTGSLVSPLLGFRLDPGEQRSATERALEGDSGDTVRAVGAALAPGAAIAAVLVEHTWAQALGDAVARTGGTTLSGAFVEAGGLSELAPVLVEAAGAD